MKKNLGINMFFIMLLNPTSVAEVVVFLYNFCILSHKAGIKYTRVCVYSWNWANKKNVSCITTYFFCYKTDNYININNWNVWKSDSVKIRLFSDSQLCCTKLIDLNFGGIVLLKVWDYCRR